MSFRLHFSETAFAYQAQTRHEPPAFPVSMSIEQ